MIEPQLNLLSQVFRQIEHRMIGGVNFLLVLEDVIVLAVESSQSRNRHVIEEDEEIGGHTVSRQIFWTRKIFLENARTTLVGSVVVDEVSKGAFRCELEWLGVFVEQPEPDSKEETVKRPTSSRRELFLPLPNASGQHASEKLVNKIG